MRVAEGVRSFSLFFVNFFADYVFMLPLFKKYWQKSNIFHLVLALSSCFLWYFECFSQL